jgi:hypothetical protein
MGNAYDNASLVLTPNGYKAGKMYSAIPTDGSGDFTFIRAGIAMRRNSVGLWEEVAANVPRLQYPVGGGCPSWLVEPQRTNSIRNNSAVGAVVGSPGTLPTNWTNFLSGLTQTIVGTGTEKGLPYIDIRLNGVASSASALILFEASNIITASNAQIWTESIFSKVVAAPNPANSYDLLMYERTSGGGYITEGSIPFVVTSALQRFSFTRTLSGGGTVAFVQPIVRFNLTNGASYDFTIRIAAPQMELGASATSPIITAGSALTRLGDLATLSKTITQLSTFVSECFLQAGSLSDGLNYRYFDVRAASNNRITCHRQNNTIRVDVVTPSGVSFSNVVFTLPTLAVGQRYIFAIRLNSGSFNFFANGALVFTSTTILMPTFTTANVNYGSDGASTQWSGSLGVFLNCDLALTDPQCIALTTL